MAGVGYGGIPTSELLTREEKRKEELFSRKKREGGPTAGKP